MNIPFQVKVPVELAMQLRDQLKAAEALHRKALDAFSRKVRAGGDPDKIIAEQKALAERGRRLTPQHFLRACIERGMRELASASAADLLKMLEQDPIVAGRPSAEVKRGPRAA